MADVETLDELNSDHNPVLLTVDSSMTSQMLRGSGHYVRWDEYRRYLGPIELPSDPFLSTDALEIGIEAFTNTLRSAKIAGTVKRPHEAIQHFPGLSEIVAIPYAVGPVVLGCYPLCVWPGIPFLVLP